MVLELESTRRTDCVLRAHCRRGAERRPRSGTWQRGAARADVARHLGWRGVFAEHEAAWTTRWQCSDIEVEGDAAAQQALRFAIYHLNSAANPADERVSIGARALTGDDYHGHVFWDTEIFLLPFYILTWPEAARALLMYRFRTLDAARAKSARMGWRGALYAWESADTGAETTPERVIGPDRQVIDILCGREEQHISADVAYAVWQYWQATGDEGFLRDAGAEIILETGRFWASRAQSRQMDAVIFATSSDRTSITNMSTTTRSPTSWHAGTSGARSMSRHCCASAGPTAGTSLSSRLGLDDAELKQWPSAADTMATGLDPETGRFEQFAGYFALEEINLADYAGRSVPMDVVLGRERTQRSQVIKQADVVALLGLLPEEFVGARDQRTSDYYEPRCSHGSSLSRAMHGLVAARLGYSEMALRYFRQTAAIDLADTHVAIDGGVHIAALGGVWLTAVFGFAGLSLRDDGVAIDPQLPAGWTSLGFGFQWRGRRLRIKIDQPKQYMEATLEEGEPMTLVVSGTSHQLTATKRSGSPADGRIDRRPLNYWARLRRLFTWRTRLLRNGSATNVGVRRRIALWLTSWQERSTAVSTALTIIPNNFVGIMPRYAGQSARLPARGGRAPHSAIWNR